MKFLLAITIISSAVCLVYSAADKEFLAKVKATGHKCKLEHKVDDETYNELVKKHNLPESENGKCMMACFMKDMGFLHDGKFNAEAMEESNKLKFDDEEMIKKANEIDKHCIEEVGTHETNECELSHKLVDCFLKKAKAESLELPEFE